MPDINKAETSWGTVGTDAARKEYNKLKEKGVRSPDRRHFLTNVLEGAQVAAIGAVIVITHLDKFEGLFSAMERMTLSDSQKKLMEELKTIPPDQLDQEYVLHNLMVVGKDGANVRKSPFPSPDNNSGENGVVARLETGVIVPKVIQVYGKNPDMPDAKGAQSIWYGILDYQGNQLKSVAFTYRENLDISESERPIAGNKKVLTLTP